MRSQFTFSLTTTAKSFGRIGDAGGERQVRQGKGETMMWAPYMRFKRTLQRSIGISSTNSLKEGLDSLNVYKGEVETV